MDNRYSQSQADQLVAHYAQQGINRDLALRVYTTRLLGIDPWLVLHGGGNTSVKLAATDLVAVSQDIGGTPVSRGAPIALLMRRVPTTRSGAHTLEAADEARYQRFTNAGNQVLTLPAAAAGISSGVYALGAEYRCRKLGSGELRWDFIVSHDLDLEELPAMFDRFREQGTFFSKVIFRP